MEPEASHAPTDDIFQFSILILSTAVKTTKSKKSVVDQLLTSC
jgi:hypothetical protein